MRSAFLSSWILLAATVAGAGELTLSFPFAPDDVAVSRRGGYDAVTLRDGVLPGDAPGIPWLPARFVNILLPAGARATEIVATADETLLRADTLVRPVQPPQPRSRERAAPVPPDPQAYAAAGRGPGAPAVLTGTHHLRGCTYVSVRLNPVRYEAATRSLYLAREIKVTVRYDEPGAAPVAPARNSALFEDAVRGLVVNPTEDGFLPRRSPALRSGQPLAAVDYLIITRAALSNAFQALADHRSTFSGLNSRVETVETITNAYPGADAQDRIRNCIKSHVSNGLAYVVLGGDSSIVPDRDCYVACWGEVESQMPTDLYYSGLDGDWNADGDSRYGETADDADLAWDVIVGRIPVTSAAQATAYINKVRNYDTNTPVQLCGKILLGGMETWDTYSGNGRPSDDVTGDGHWGFRDAAHPAVCDAEMWTRRMYRDGIRPYWLPFTVGMLFDTLTSWDTAVGGDYAQNATSTRSRFNLGWYHLFFSGHGNVTVWGLESGGFYSSDATALTGKTLVVYTDACLTGAFDDGTDPCLSEAFLRNATGGALVYLGCSRYGWGEPDSSPASNTSDGGPSTQYGYHFYRRLHETNRMVIGKAFAMHKADKAGESTYDGADRWIQFGLNYQGDPALRYVPPTNIPPAVALSPTRTNRSVEVSNTLTFAVVVSEWDGDDLALWSTNLPPGAVFPATNGLTPLTSTFSWTPSAAQTGAWNVAFRAGDKDGTNSVTARITVREAGAALDLSGYRIVQYNAYTNFVIPDGVELPARGYLVVARNVNKTQFQNYWGVTLAADVTFLNASNRLIAINGGEQYEVYDDTGLSVDGATPSERDPNYCSVRRKNASDDAAAAGSWMSGASSNSATPGRGGWGQGTEGLVISEYSDAVGSPSNEFIELYFDSSPRVGTNEAPGLAVDPGGVVRGTLVSNLFSLGVTATEPNANPLRLWATNLPAGASFAATNGVSPLSQSFVWTPTNTGTNVVVFLAGDRDGTNAVVVTVVVTNTGREGGGCETFGHFPESGSIYASGTFLGQDGSTWTYVRCRGDKPIDGPSPCLERSVTTTSEVYSGTLYGGCGTVAFDCRQEYSMGVKLDVLVNSTLIGTVVFSNQGVVQAVGPFTADVAGAFVLRLRQSYGTLSGQVSVDNITWTSYGSTFVDTDGDGMDDAWELARFGTLTNSAAGDNDDDGCCNGEEYGADTDPLDQGSYFEIGAVSLGAGFSMDFLSTNSRVYLLQGSDVLWPAPAWCNLGDAVAGSNGLLSLSDTNSAALRVYRVRVRVP